MKPFAIILSVVFLFPFSADAGIVVSITEVGSDVVASWDAGSFNLSGLGRARNGADKAGIQANHVELGFGGQGNANNPISIYEDVLTGPAVIGSGSQFIEPASGTGARFGVVFDDAADTSGTLWVPRGYSSGAMIPAGTNTWTSQTIAGLGLTAGTYTWTWPTTSPLGTDFFTLQIGTAAVPEPSSMILMGIAALGLIVLHRRKEQAST